MMEKQKERVVTYRIEDIEYIRVHTTGEGESDVDIEYTRVPKNESIFEEKFIGNGICEYCGYIINPKTGQCCNPNCPEEQKYVDEQDIVDYLNQLNTFESCDSCIICINDRKYRINGK